MSEFKTTEATLSTPEQTRLLMDDGGCKAWAQLVAGHIRRGLESGAWVVASGRAIPAAMLHFYQDNGKMAREETCEQIAH